MRPEEHLRPRNLAKSNIIMTFAVALFVLVAGTVFVLNFESDDSYGASVGDLITVANGEGTEITYKITSVESGNQTVQVGTGSSTEWAIGTDVKTLTIPDKVTYESVTYKVTEISDYAFYEYTTLTSVTIPSGITAIGHSAFYGCSSLESITIPESVTTIENGAFYGCSGLTSIEISATVTSIGMGTFANCSGLTEIKVNTSNSKYSSENGVLFNKDKTTLITYPSGKSGEYTIPSSVTSIGEYAFNKCDALSAINVDPNNTKYSSENGVLFNKDKTTIITYPPGKSGDYTIPSSVTSIGSYAFEYCNALTSVTIPNTVTTIGFNAFIECSGLESITIPSSVTSIGEYAFNKCDALSAINVDPNNTKYSSENGVLFNKDKTTLIAYPSAKSGDYTIPNTVTTIEEYAFHKCTALTSVTIPSGVATIEYGTFYGCSALTSVIIPNTVTTIEDYAFGNCNALTSVTIPNTVTTIGYRAFEYCSALTSVTIPESVITIESYAFRDCSALTSVTISSSVTSIGNYAFYRCNALSAINVDSNNSKYSSEDGVLFNKDKTTLIAYPSAKSGDYTIPESVTSTTYGAFELPSNPISITIPKKVTIIEYSFVDCNNITIVILDKDTTFEEHSIYNVLHSDPNITVKAPIDYKIPESAKEGEIGITYCYSYKITVNDGTTDKTEYYTGDVVTIVANTAPEGKGFSGWTVVSGDVVLSDNKTATTTFTMPANAVEVTANYATAYTVTYDKGSGSGTPPTVGTKIHGETFIVNTEYTLTKEGYTQIGWKTGAESTDGTGAITTYSDDANVTLYPVWKEYVEPSNDGGFPIIIVAIVAVIAIAGVGAFFYLRGKP